MLLLLFIVTFFLNICNRATPLVDSMNYVFGIHLSGLGYFAILFILALIFD